MACTLAVNLPRALVLPLLLALTAVPARAEPLKVAIGMHVNDLRAVDMRSQSFSADLYVWLRFPTAGLDEAKLAAVLSLEPVNGKFDSKEVNDEKLVDGVKYICWRVIGTFHFMPDLKRYPFDEQHLPIVFESAALETDELVLVDDRESYARGGTPEDRWGLAPTVVVPDFTIRTVQREVFEGNYPTNFGDPQRDPRGTRYSRFALRTSFVRDYWSYTFKILIPLFVILAMAWFVFFLPPDQIGTSASVAVTALLSSVAFNVAVSSSMPDVGYLVLSDKFFLGTYLLLLATLGMTVVTYLLDVQQRRERALSLLRVARYLFPAFTAGLLTIFFLGL